MTKTLVLYVFHNFNDRVQHFINNAVFFDENIDFIFIANDRNIQFEVPTYAKKLVRDNIGFDFGGWSEGLFTDNLYKNYEHFIFVNSSVKGPFLPEYYKGKWTDIYLNNLKDNVKLFGSTINTCGNPTTHAHVQSYIFSMDISTLQYLMDSAIFSMTNYAKTFGEAIWNKEVLMSRKILEKGWNIDSLLPLYKNVDFTFRTKSPHNYSIPFLDDLMYMNFRGVLWNEHQLVFVKGNRIQI